MTPEQLNYLCQNTKCLKPIQSHGYCEVCSVAYGHGYAQGQAEMRETEARYHSHGLGGKTYPLPPCACTIREAPQ